MNKQTVVVISGLWKYQSTVHLLKNSNVGLSVEYVTAKFASAGNSPSTTQMLVLYVVYPNLGYR